MPKLPPDYYEKRERLTELYLVDSLIEAAEAALDLGDQVLLGDIERIAERAAEAYNVPAEKCGDCKLEMTKLQYALAQGLCGACAGARMAEMET